MSPSPERIIIAMNAATIASDTMPTRSDLSRFHASAHRPGETSCGTSRTRGARSAWPGVLIGPPRSLELHPRIDRLVHQVGEQIGRHRRKRGVDGDRLDDREIGALDGEDHLAADARNRE